MNRFEKLESVLANLDSLHRDLKLLNVPVDTMSALNNLCDMVELDMREEYHNFQNLFLNDN